MSSLSDGYTSGNRQRLWRVLPAASRDEPAQDVGLDRRAFLKLLSASLAGLTACSRPPREEIVPFVHPPLQPRAQAFYASALVRGGCAHGVLVRNDMGRPTKIEGNPQHPTSQGATDAIMQAAVLELWDPDRSRSVRERGRIATWDAALGEFAHWRETLRDNGGAGLRVLSGAFSSPTLKAQRARLLARYPKARWHVHEPIALDAALTGADLVFGTPLAPRYRFARARTVLALDADFLSCPHSGLRHARDFATARRVSTETPPLRLYAIEGTPTLTGMMADHRWPLASRKVEGVARELARRLGVDAGPGETHDVPAAWIDAAVHDLSANRGASLIVAGYAQPPSVHALAYLMNRALGNLGTTLTFGDPVVDTDSFGELLDDLRRGAVDSLLVLDANPAYTAPAGSDFAELLARVPRSVHCGLYFDETARNCVWHVPEAHALEQWSDACADDGTASIVQPLIAPLYEGRSPHTLIAALAGEAELDPYTIVRAHWRERFGDKFDSRWDAALRSGIVAGTATPDRNPEPRPDAVARLPAAQSSTADGLELRFSADTAVWDGRYANNAWLQEMPRPFSELTWGNAVLVSPALGLGDGDVVELRFHGRTLLAPAMVQPGQAEDSVCLALGYGRRGAGHVGDGVGVDAYTLRTADAPWFGAGLTLRRTGAREALACTQRHFELDGGDPVRRLRYAEYRAHPEAARREEKARSLYAEFPRGEHAWAMSIDLGACIGCKACVVACQAENNVPVVGAEQVRRGREMHWLRVDRYYEGTAERPRCYHQPVPCMHCEHAPCELVCPVEATVHDSEGLNVQVYNRCIGTRFCSNNCPYKVRRFNFLRYPEPAGENAPALHNPQVSVRRSGVMEKCTFCIQRIAAARSDADAGGRPLADGDVVTACQAACPTRAIRFGDLADPASEVSAAKRSPLDYALLGELNTRPRTTYLARVTDARPGLEDV